MVANEKATLREYYGLAEKQSEAPLEARESAAEWAKTHSLESMMKHSVELMEGSYDLTYEGIKDLKADHQSLVYNHHQELVTASETIGKMRGGLAELQRRRDKLKDQIFRIDAQRETVASQESASFEQINWDRTVAPVVELPSKLREEAQLSETSARQLYGEHKKTITDWVDADVDGAQQIRSECEEIISS